VRHVRDGDTIVVSSMPIPLIGLAASEGDEPGGVATTSTMVELVDGRTLRCESAAAKIDRYAKGGGRRFEDAHCTSGHIAGGRGRGTRICLSPGWQTCRPFGMMRVRKAHPAGAPRASLAARG